MSSSASVRVCARFRPVNKVEKDENAHIVIKIPQETQVTITRLGFEKKMFFLDHIFPPDATQMTVYKYAGEPLISEIMKGYNGTIFAYGQTGSGKTHTMQGDLESERQRGLVPRMIDALFDAIMDADENLEFVIKVSFVEIYLEKLRDLLEEKNRNLKIRESKAQGIYIEGIASPYVGSPEEIMELIELGTTLRSTSAHRMNDVSSRSHAVFIFRLIATNKETQSKKMSKLMLVDLAGSEKTRKTQAQGQRLEEAKNINQSLSTLGQVINALSTGKGHVPYRDSKLTRLLTDSLGGNSKTCIIVTCSPCDYNVEESISTLRFGVNCKKVKNIPVINQELSISEYKTKLKKMTDREKALLKKIAILECQNKALKAALIAAGGDVDDVLKDAQKEIDILEEEKAQSEGQGGHSGRERNTRAGAAARSVLAAMDTAGDTGLLLLKERIDELEDLYNQEADEKERYMDDIADVRSELEIAEQQVKDLEKEAEKFHGKKKETDESLKKMAEQVGEYRLYKLKLESVEKENEIVMMKKRQEIGELSHRLKKANERLLEAELSGNPEAGSSLPPISEKDQDLMSKFNPENIDMSGNDEAWKEQMTERYNQLYRRLLREIQENRELRVSSADGVSGGNDTGTASKESGAMVNVNIALEKRIKEQKKYCDKLRREIKSVEMRERYNNVLRQNYQEQLMQVERMLVFANQVHNRDRVRFTNQIEDKDSELNRLKSFVTKITKSRGNKSRRAGRRMNNVMVPVQRKVNPEFRKRILKPRA